MSQGVALLMLVVIVVYVTKSVSDVVVFGNQFDNYFFNLPFSDAVTVVVDIIPPRLVEFLL